MYKILTLNKIAPAGLSLFSHDNYETASEITNPDAILLRSFKMNDMVLPENLLAIARAGTGVNNIPVARCSEQGIVVFNTPGANSNAVKEMVIAGLLLSSRNIIGGINWLKTLAGKGSEFSALIEQGKSRFAGPEILGKTLGVIGLGAIGRQVANAAEALGMKVIGYDPYISVDSAWGLSRNVKKAKGLENLLNESDYISMHVPLTDSTREFLDKSRFMMMKNGARIMNFARGELIRQADLLDALDNGKVACYVTDFPNDNLLKHEKVICIPHLGASTPESETNCAVMAVNQLREFLENGNISNSVNFPAAEMASGNGFRLCIVNKNIPKMVGQITTVLANENVNIEEMLNRHHEDIAYNIINVNQAISQKQVEAIKNINGVIRVRVIHTSK
ncbi:MAG TPA: phosphoglycerate dehydrogenase [Cyclobacteriaceae bacterium]|nr:phosphoglycerate dehydrogenase [Cyclobacteriaceae bacterium]